MQAFVRRLICFLAIQVCVWVGVLTFGSQYKAVNFDTKATGYLAASIDKHHLLVQQSSPRIVFIGGSNLAFGLDSSEIERSLGYHPINMGLHLGLGLDFMLAEVKPFLKAGDVVLISPEYEYFVDMYNGDGGTLFTEIELQPYTIQFLNFRNIALLLDQGLIVVGGMTRHHVSWLVDFLTGESYRKLPEPTTVYRRSAFNQFGDVIAHHDFAPKHFLIDQYKTPTPDSIHQVINGLNKFNERCQHKHVLVFYSYPPIVKEQIQVNADIIHEIALNLRQRLQFPLLDTPEEMSFPLHYFFDGPYHLNVPGTQIRTGHLIERLRGKLARVFPAASPM